MTNPTKEPVCAVCDRAFSDHVSVISHDFVHQKTEVVSSKQQLKPCPFCGSHPTAKWYGDGPAGDDGYFGIDCCQAFAHESDEHAAAEKWNRRAVETTAPLDRGTASIFVDRWLWHSPERKTTGESWSREQKADVAQMLLDATTGQPTTACRHDWISVIGGIRCATCGVQIAARCLPEEPTCTCPSGDGSLRWPCPVHPPTPVRHCHCRKFTMQPGIALITDEHAHDHVFDGTNCDCEEESACSAVKATCRHLRRIGQATPEGQTIDVWCQDCGQHLNGEPKHE